MCPIRPLAVSSHADVLTPFRRLLTTCLCCCIRIRGICGIMRFPTLPIFFVSFNLSLTQNAISSTHSLPPPPPSTILKYLVSFHLFPRCGKQCPSICIKLINLGNELFVGGVRNLYLSFSAVLMALKVETAIKKTIDGSLVLVN